MRFPFRKKDKKKSDGSAALAEPRSPAVFQQPKFPPSYRSAQLLANLSSTVLARIFAFVCPHTRDESYETCEQSTIESACMLCDLRDLAHCARVSRSWRDTALKVLYHSVRIDQVHYCKREAFLAEKRKHTRFDRNGIPEDPAQARLRLFRRTVREDPTRIGKQVIFLKTPYMVREFCHVELAQTIAVLPNLKFVDLPEGMFSDEPSCATLRLEVQARCPNIRKMTYNGGAERSLATLATGRVWQSLEVLELNSVNVDILTMRAVLASLTNLRALKISGTESLSDEVLTSTVDGPAIPHLEELVLEDTPRVTAAGLMEYLAWQTTAQQTLKVLTLKETGVQPQRLQEILAMAPWLKTLAIQAKISEAFPHNAGIPLLASRSLETLRYEISAVNENGAYASMKDTYYTYLASSVLAGSIPKLRKLYVHDITLPDKLQGLPPPSPGFAGGNIRASANLSGMASPPSPGFAGGIPRSPGNFSGMASPSSPGFAGHVRASPNLSAISSSPFQLSPAPRRTISQAPAAHRFSSNNPFAAHMRAPPPVHTLEVYTKTDESGTWSFSRVDALTRSWGGSRRPVSSYGLAADVTGQGWDRGEARRSILVGDGSGVYLPLPAPPELVGPDGTDSADLWRPQSSGGESTRRRPSLM